MEALARIERQIERRERRERVHRILIVGLSLLAVGAFVSGHLTGVTAGITAADRTKKSCARERSFFIYKTCIIFYFWKKRL